MKDQRPKTNDQSISYVVGTVDLYPTIMELCGIEMPYAGDGESMMPLMNNPEMDTWKNATFSYFRKGISLRTERYRLTKYFRNQEPVIELYDHNNDPYESKNIAQDNPEITDSLMRIWEKGNTGLYSSK